MKRLLFACALMLAPVLARADVPSDRLAVLARGVNVVTVFTAKPVQQIIGDLHEIRDVGFRHVRVFVDPEWVLRADLTGSRLDQVVTAAGNLHLGVVLCMLSGDHPLNDDAHDDDIKLWSRAWRKLAQHYADRSSLVFFELANEPSMQAQRWAKVQDQLLDVVRDVAPNSTVLLTASPLSMVWSLRNLPVSSDPDVLYTIHEYQPMVFTHQGADWEAEYKTIHGLEYPPNRENVENVRQHAAISLATDLSNYLKYGSDAIKTELTVARNWATAHHVHIVVTEFGVYRTAPTDSRARWLAQARQSMEAAGFGWSVWEYDAGFGIKTEVTAPGCNSVKKALGFCQ